VTIPWRHLFTKLTIKIMARHIKLLVPERDQQMEAKKRIIMEQRNRIQVMGQELTHKEAYIKELISALQESHSVIERLRSGK